MEEKMKKFNGEEHEKKILEQLIHNHKNELDFEYMSHFNLNDAAKSFLNNHVFYNLVDS